MKAEGLTPGQKSDTSPSSVEPACDALARAGLARRETALRLHSPKYFDFQTPKERAFMASPQEAGPLRTSLYE